MNTNKILIVDDEPDILKLTSFRLKKLGYDVLTAADGGKALDVMCSEKPDLVLLDLIIPFISGQEVCKRVKKNKKIRHIPIILFTAQSDTMTAEKAKELGADDYIVKPFDTTELINKMERFLTERAVL